MKLPPVLGAWITIHLSPRFRWRARVRHRLAARYLTGRGIEIGGLIMPVAPPPGVHVIHVDAWPPEQLWARYPQYRWVRMVPLDLVCDGEGMDAVADGSLDFLIANHLIEHCQDPLGTLERWLRRLRSGGVVFMAVPDKRRTFDRDRPLTTVAHVLRDYREGPAWSEQAHWEEFVDTVIGAPLEHRAAVIADEQSRDHRPHYHVWTATSFAEMLNHARTELGLPFVVEEIREVGIEFIVLLRRT